MAAPRGEARRPTHSMQMHLPHHRRHRRHHSHPTRPFTQRCCRSHPACYCSTPHRRMQTMTTRSLRRLLVRSIASLKVWMRMLLLPLVSCSAVGAPVPASLRPAWTRVVARSPPPAR